MNLTGLQQLLTGGVLTVLAIIAGLTMINRSSHMDHRGTAVHATLFGVGAAVVALALKAGGVVAFGNWFLSLFGL